MNRNLNALQSKRLWATTLAFSLAYSIHCSFWVALAWKATGSLPWVIAGAALAFASIFPWFILLMMLGLTPETPLPDGIVWLLHTIGEFRFLLFAPVIAGAVLVLWLFLRIAIPLRTKRVEFANMIHPFLAKEGPRFAA